MCSSALYFILIRTTDEVDELAAWEASPPFFLGLFSLYFGIVLGLQQWMGILIIAVSLFFIRQRGALLRIQIQDHFFLLVHTILLALSFMIFDYMLLEHSYFSVLPFVFLGESTGLLLLLLPQERASLKQKLRSIKKHYWLFVVAEICAVLAFIAQTYAFQTLHPAIATALSDSYPILLFFVGPFLSHFFGVSPEMFPQSHNRFHLCFLLMFIGGLVLLL